MKTKTILIFCLLFSLSVTSASALTWDDVFPPAHVQDSNRKPPLNAESQEVKSTTTHSNTLETNQASCPPWRLGLDRTWGKVTETQWVRVGTTPEGDPIMQQQQVEVPQDARDVKQEANVDKVSNTWLTRIAHYTTAAGPIVCDPNNLIRSQNSYGPNGRNITDRSQPEQYLRYLRGIYIKEAIESLAANNENPKDVVTQDEPLVWSCGGTCTELKDGNKNSCRSVTVAELAWHYKSKGQKIIYDDPVKMNLVGYPSNKEFDNFKDFYEKRFGTSLSPLSDETYDLIYNQLNPVPKGNTNEIYTITNFLGVDANLNPINPAPTPIQRAIPNSAPAASSQMTNVMSSFKPAEIKDHVTNISDDSVRCNNEITDKPNKIDTPTPLDFWKQVIAFLKHLLAGETWTYDKGYNIANIKTPDYNTNAQLSEDFYAYIVPEEIHQKFKDREAQNFACKADSQDNPSDTGCKAETMFKIAQPMLLPADWQKAQVVSYNPNGNNSSGNTSGNSGGGITASTISSGVKQYCPIITKYSNSSFTSSIIAAIITVETGGNPDAISNAGAVGLMQVMASDGLSAQLYPGMFKDRPTVSQLKDPDTNIKTGLSILNKNLGYWGNVRDAIMHYGPMDYGYTYADKVMSLAAGSPDFCSNGNLNL